MKLNHDCIRDLMLSVEENLKIDEVLESSDLESFAFFSKYSEEDIVYTILKLSEAHYLKVETQYGDDTLQTLLITDVTWSGHQFLDTIRDNKVWKNTKSIVSKFSSVSVTLLKEVASTVLLEMIHKQINQS
ncbi:hypothetical protein A5819_000004 [Enterococcus sp. 7E2_DIV0204]|uniref:DUF2513 domain-containing protein n=1 Tax=unclassified Enterococcus TaxID=2608891 RepID=UPI000A35C1FA|nr:MULTISPECIES: DUF2513 domain-containing protein [unclassified Enterococcus]OTN87558.1 hypothetical protein A5819_000004 [Enterococcus sp. 7E2_DIV0204]OTP49756.1 hypothetical protein A5884_002956 [Enterococcus sp. 7D2_DIV0200]